MVALAVPDVAAQRVPAVGSDETLDVATWNIEWFGSTSGPVDDDRQIANVRAIIEQAGIDLWALQEISDRDDFEMLLDALGDGYDGFLATESGSQRIGFIYRTDVISNTVFQHLLTSFSYAFAGRLPLQMEADVTLGGTTQRLSFITLHMKCCSDRESYDRRADAARRLKTNIDFLRAGDPIILLGDFNDELTGSIRTGQPSPYAIYLQDTANYTFLTLPMEEDGVGTFCGSDRTCSNASNLDHILITNEVVPFYEHDSTARFEALLDAFDGTGGACDGEFVCTTSDHLPVVARFRFDVANATETAEVPRPLALAPAYPNPFTRRTTLTFTLPRATGVRVDVFDVLGRHIQTLADDFWRAGEHRLSVDAAGWPPGVYGVRFRTPKGVVTHHIVRGR